MKIPNARQIEDSFVRWREHPVTFVRELFGVEPDPWQEKVLEAFPHTPMTALQACKGPGKLESKINRLDTPNGVRIWGDLRAGDLVFAEDGSPTQIVQTYDQGVVPLFRVTFDDGSFARVGAEHLWKVQGRTERRKNLGWAVLTTEQIRKRGVTISNGRWQQKQFIIPRQGAAQFPVSDQPVDSYVVGVWLGDGTKSETHYTKPYREVEEEIQRRGYFTSRHADGKSVKILRARSAFELLDCFETGSHQRFVPAGYKYASVRQRTDLLCGLMDTDGTIGKDGHMEFASTSRMLADDVVWLVRSLGGVALIKDAIKEGWYYGEDGEKIECRDCYRVTVVLDFNPFRIGHKAERWQNPLRSRSTERYLTRFISSIEPDGEEDSMCIEVAHPSHCYLTNDFIVTHNTCVMAWLGLNFLVTRPFAKIGATSIDGNNLRDNLWAEFASWRNKSPLLQSLIEWTSKRVFMKTHPENWFISARTWPKKGDPKSQADTLAGLHADYVMFLIDESGGIPPAVGVSAEAALSTGKECRIVQAGNPTDVNGMLYQASKDRLENGGRWMVVEITADPDDSLRAPRVDPEWARSQIRTYGRDNPWVMVNVLGKFPAGSIGTLISEEEVREAQRRHYQRHYLTDMPRIIGADVARQGLDSSVVCRRQGLQVFPLNRYRNVTGLEGAAALNRIWADFDADACFVDATGGFGFTWIDQLTVLGRQAIPVQFAGSASNPERYVNKRAEMYFKTVEWVRMGGALPDDSTEGGSQLAEALFKTQYFHKRDMLQLEEKDQVRERLGFSPDEADSLVVTFAEPVAAKRRGRPANHNAAVEQWSPFAQLDRLNDRQYNAAVDYDPFPRQ